MGRSEIQLHTHPYKASKRDIMVGQNVWPTDQIHDFQVCGNVFNTAVISRKQFEVCEKQVLWQPYQPIKCTVLNSTRISQRST